MKLVVRTDSCGGNDIGRVIEYAGKLGITDVFAFPQIGECYDASGLMKSEKLQAYKKRFDDSGLDLRILTETIYDDALVSPEAAKARAEVISQTIDVMGKAGIDTLFLFVAVAFPEEKKEREQKWRRLTAIYQKIVPHAEKAKVRLATHGHQTPQYLIRNYESLNRLLDAAPSAYNGVTFCMGCHQLAGDDLRQTMRRFGDKIFFVHARDVIRTANGFSEVLYGTGEVDVIGVLGALKDMGYDGLISPEHLPVISHDTNEAISIAWGLGYLAAVMAVLEQ